MDTTDFDKYLDRTVALTVTKQKLSRSDGTEVEIEYFEVDPACQIINEIRALAESKGMMVRVWTPKMFATAEYQSNRLNVKVDRLDDGTFVINRLSIG